MAVRLEEQLLVAVSKGDTRLVDDLLSKKPDVNYNDSGQFPLLLASQKGNKDIVQRLIDAKADVNMCGISGMTSLALASECGHDGIIKVLIEKGAEVDRQIQDGHTPLMIACQHGHTKAVNVLLSKNANVDSFYGYSRYTPIMFACQSGHVDIVQMLLPHYKLQVHGATLLAIASVNGHDQIVAILLKEGIDVDTRCANDWNALHLASQYGHEKVVEVLLKNGADVDIRTGDGYSALIRATENGHTEVVRVLLEFNAELDLRLHGELKTSLMIACEKRNAQIVKLLLRGESQEPIARPKQSHSVNLWDKRGCTALNYACISGDVEIVRILIKHGANVNPETSVCKCQSPLLLATKYGHASIVQILLKNGANPNFAGDQYPPPLIVATVREYTEIIKLLLNNNKADVDVRYGRKQYVTSLMFAIFSGKFDIVKILVKSGANILFSSNPNLLYMFNVQNRQRSALFLEFTCIDLANVMGNTKIKEFLLSRTGNTDRECILCRETDQSYTRTCMCVSTPIKEASVSELIKEEYSNIAELEYNEMPNLSCKMTNLSEILPKEVIPTTITVKASESARSSNFGETPKINNTFRLLLSVASQWEDIGILLNIDDGDLCSIKADNKQVRECLREMLRLWLKRVDPRPTWEDLAEAVESLGEAKLAAEIKEKYITV